MSRALYAAFYGGDKAFLMNAQVTGSANHPNRDLLLSETAYGAGVQHVVRLSVYEGGANDDAIWRRRRSL